jgi:hypothetical protein
MVAEGGSSYDCSPYRSSSLTTFRDLSRRKRWAYFEEFLALEMGRCGGDGGWRRILI